MRMPRLRIWMLMLVVAIVGIALEVRRELRISRIYRIAAQMEEAGEMSNRDMLKTSENDLREAKENLAKELERAGSTKWTADEWRELVEDAQKEINYFRKWTEWFAERRRIRERVARRPWERPGEMTVPKPPDDF